MDPNAGKPDPEEILEAMAKSARDSEEPILERSEPETNRAELHDIWVQRGKRAQEFYEAGTTFYTKQAIRDFDQKLQAIKQKWPGDYEVTMTDFEGKLVELPGRSVAYHCPPEL